MKMDSVFRILKSFLIIFAILEFFSSSYLTLFYLINRFHYGAFAITPASVAFTSFLLICGIIASNKYVIMVSISIYGGLLGLCIFNAAEYHINFDGCAISCDLMYKMKDCEGCKTIHYNIILKQILLFCKFK